MWHSLWQGEFTPNRKQAQPPRVSPHYCFVGGVKFPQGDGSAVVHRKKNDLLHKDTTYTDKYVSPTDSGNVNSLVIVKKLKSPRVSPHYCFVGGVKFPQGEGSAVIHRKKNDLLHKYTPTDSGKNSHVVGTGRKQAQDPLGSLHTIVSSVE